ncbi:MAG: rRNA maturation RNase YbeY [Phycisphaerales bacterium]|nr:MAG: rRNA maturation RNase YbeY [Phycisphaerales bacterium]
MEDDSEFNIAVAYACGQSPNADRLIQAAVRTTLDRHKVSKALISVAVVDDAHIARLNQTHLNHQGPTDVLAFDLSDDEGTAVNEGGGRETTVEGEIVVSYETAAREAYRRDHDCNAELALYTVHGTLHLLGHNDHSPEDAARMHQLEDDILESLKLGPVFRGKLR